MVGVTLLVASAVTFSSAGIFTKGVAAGAWEVIFWRGVFAGVFTTGWIAKRGAVRREFLKMGKSGIAVAIVLALGTSAFIPAFKFTSIANVSLIYAVAPLIAAVMAWMLVKEPLTRRVLLGSLVALVGVLVIVSGSIGELHLRGDLLALFMTVCMAGVMVIYRMHPETPGAGPSVLQSLILIVPSLIFGTPFETAPSEIAILAGFGFLFAIASVTLAEGAKRVPAGQTALLSALETPLAPVLAFLIFTEVPNQASFVGGAIVLVAVLASIRDEGAG
jgi:drug/metabolite transporter (DMT)-like permease